MTFHFDRESISRYRSNLTDRTTSASVEAHLFSCAQCRSLLEPDTDMVERTWHRVRDSIEPGRLSFLERLLAAIRVPGHIARLIAVTPNLRLSFVLAIGLALVFALLANAAPTDTFPRLVFVLVAPIVPVVGVALAYGRGTDPLFDLTLSTPISALNLILARAVAVLTVSIGGSLVAWWLAPQSGGVGVAAWLLPALSLTVTTIALASKVEIVPASVIVATVWVVAVLVSQAKEVPLGWPGAEIFNLALLAASLAVMASRRSYYEREGGRR